jgi:hypothetical protein
VRRSATGGDGTAKRALPSESRGAAIVLVRRLTPFSLNCGQNNETRPMVAAPPRSAAPRTPRTSEP